MPRCFFTSHRPDVNFIVYATQMDDEDDVCYNEVMTRLKLANYNYNNIYILINVFVSLFTFDPGVKTNGEDLFFLKFKISLNSLLLFYTLVENRKSFQCVKV